MKLERWLDAEKPFFGLLLLVLFGAAANQAYSNDSFRIAAGEGSEMPRQPQCAITSSGIGLVVFGIDNDLMLSRSTSEQGEFSTPVRIASVSNLALGMRRGPRIEVTNDSVVVTAIVGEKGKGQDGDLLAWRSLDSGITWLGPTQGVDLCDP